MRLARRQFLNWLSLSFLAPIAHVQTLARGQGSSKGPKLKRMPILDQVRPIAPAEFDSRIQTAQKAMAKDGFAGLLLEPGTNQSYFIGFRFGRSERLVCVVLPNTGAPFFVAPAFEAELFRDHPVVHDVVTWEEHENPYARVFESLRHRDVRSGILGVDPTARLFVYDGLKKEASGFNVDIGSGIIDPLRMRKDAHELALMRAAIAVTEEAIRQTWRRVRPGMSERELAGELRQVYGELGSPGGGLVQFASTSAIPHGRPGDRQLQEGDVVLIDCGTRVHGYGSDITRTAVYARSTPKVEEIWKIVREAQQAAIDRAGPGVTCEEVDQAARQVIEKAGYGRFFIHRLGHGLGMDGHEKPYLVRGNRTALEPGMTVTIEPGIYLPGEFGVRIEDDFVITQSGCEPLSHLVDKLEVI